MVDSSDDAALSPLVELVDVVKAYGDRRSRPALDGFSVRVDPGELTILMGPSGSGKTTVLNLIAGLDRPTSGRVLVGGQDLGTMGEAALARFRRSRLGFIYQFFQLLNHMTVLDNVMLPAQLAGQRAAAARTRAEQLLADLGVADHAHRYPGQLSGGQQQAVAVARALVNDPMLVLADEPTGALDSRSGERVMDMLVQLGRNGHTILLVTHDAKLAALHGRRVVSILDGRVVHDAVLEATSAEAADVVRLLMAESSDPD